jgi:hypothetical protein
MTMSVHQLFMTFVLLMPAVVSSLSTKTPNSPAVTIAVCTGLDCRIDGASGSLKQIQRRISQLKKKKQDNHPDDLATITLSKILVTSRPCLGPCGDGPCVLVLDGAQKRVVQQQPKETLVGPGSLAPADMFGVNLRGVYQVRTQQNVDFVVELAASTVGLEEEENIPSAFISTVDTTIIATSTRPWFDRPRNECKFSNNLHRPWYTWTESIRE